MTKATALTHSVCVTSLCTEKLKVISPRDAFALAGRTEAKNEKTQATGESSLHDSPATLTERTFFPIIFIAFAKHPEAFPFND